MIKRCSNPRSSARRGAIAILAAILMVLTFAILAMSVDMGMAYVNRAELQRSADAAALAAANQLREQQLFNPTVKQSSIDARDTAAQFAALNSVGAVSPALANDDVTIGFLADLSDPSAAIDPGTFFYNAARVRVQRTAAMNGEIPLFFARVLGVEAISQMAEGTAGFVSAFKGFAAPSNGQNLEILPFALDVDTWNDVLNGLTQDEWSFDPLTGEIYAGADGVSECNLFPQGTGLPGNRGTVDIGHSGNSTNDIKRQITDGISPGDLAYHGGKLEFDHKGEMELNGDTGISAGFKAELSQIKGEPRMIPIFDYAEGNGNNANFRIVMWAGIRIMEVKLTGAMKSKRLMVQCAPVMTLGGIPGDDVTKTKFIYSPVKLIR